MSQRKELVLHNDNFNSFTSSMLKRLRKDSNFYDISLGCSDSNGKPLKAHKVIISAFSVVINEMINQSQMLDLNGPIRNMMFFKGVSHQDLSYILDFIYHGEALVEEERLASFLSLAEELKIQGLSNVRISFKDNLLESVGPIEDIEIYDSTNHEHKAVSAQQDPDVQIVSAPSCDSRMIDELQMDSCESLINSDSTSVDKIKEIPSTGGYRGCDSSLLVDHNEEQISCDERNMDKSGDSKVDVIVTRNMPKRQKHETLKCDFEIVEGKRKGGKIYKKGFWL